MQIKHHIAFAVIIGSLALPLAAQTANVISVEEASAIALSAQPGTIAEAELDQFEGKAAYDIEIVNQDGQEIEFKIDGETGEILNVWTDDDPTDDPGSATLDDVTFLIPGDLGGGWDTAARAVGEALTSAGVGEDLVFENQAGENGAVGLSYMIENAEALSNTLFINTTQIVTRSLNGTYTSSYTDLVPVAAPIADFAAFIVHPDSNIQTMADLLEAYQNDASGFAIGGGTGPKGMDHLAAAIVIEAAEEDPSFRYVQFDAVEPAFAALAAGEVTSISTEYTRALSLSEQGIVRILGVTAPEDYPLADGISNMHDQDLDVDFTTWTGFFAAPDTPEQVIEGYDAAFASLYETDVWSAAVAGNNWLEVRADSELFSEYLEEQHEQIEAILEELDAQ
ncbi:MAG: tripartite tricarboxylate transporter substrate-binding protein [Pseudomonadota bacterium]